MDVRSAEFTKYAANAMLATRISFMNELANLADRWASTSRRCATASAPTRASATASCTPARLWRLLLPERRAGAGAHGAPVRPGPADPARRGSRQRQAETGAGRKVVKRFGDDLSGKHFAVWGLAFKPNTDDMREAPSRVLLRLLARGATVAVYDPVAMAEARACWRST
jgi:UDPglucose 6-dehydrogenase